MEFEVIGDLTSFQVIAESGRGDPGNVVLVGGYLDTFIGPGINSNGSGVAAILETAEQLAGVETRNRVRFAFWTGGGFVTSGSTAYVNSLSQAELDAIALYIDVRSIGSPNYARFVLDGDVSSPSLEAPPGSEAIASFFTDFYTSRGLTSEPLLGTSDYSVFSGVGIPVGGISAGSDGTKTELQAAVYGGTAGSPFDPCFQAACDTYDNVSLEILDLNSDAIAAATLAFAMSTESVNGVKGHGRFKPGTRGSPVSNQVTR
jgi:Zn-dependent M28 family amino/carboxypeptidase